MASTPAPLPHLGLLDGLSGIAVSASSGAPAPLPALGLVLAAGAPPPPPPPPPPSGPPALRFDDGVPVAWMADQGFASTYFWQQLGVPVARRDETSVVPAQGGYPAPLPHLGLLLTGTGLVTATVAIVESGTDTVSVTIGTGSASVQVSVVEDGSDVLQAIVSVAAPGVPVTVTLAITEAGSDTFAARVAAGPAGAATGAFLFKVPPEYRLWPVQ